jgi:membrane-bound ClpP family serine protease
MKTKLVCIAALMFLLVVATNVSAGQNEVYIIKVADAISPGTAEFIKTGIKTAEERGWIHPVVWQSLCALSSRTFWAATCRWWYL